MRFEVSGYVAKLNYVYENTKLANKVIYFPTINKQKIEQFRSYQYFYELSCLF